MAFGGCRWPNKNVRLVETIDQTDLHEDELVHDDEAHGDSQQE